MELVRFQFHPVLLESFIELPYRLHARNSRWIPPFRDQLVAQLSPRAAIHTHGEMVHVLAFEGREPVARCSAIINRRYQDEGEPLGFIGFFEAHDSFAAAEEVLGEAVQWLRSRGIRQVRGPINASTYQPYRFMTQGFDQDPFFLEPYNPSCYPVFWERFGFKVCREYVSSMTDSQATADQLVREHQRTKAAGYTTRPFNLERFDDELRLMFDLSTRSFSGAWMWRPIEFSEFQEQYGGMRAILDPALCLFMFKGEEPVGFIFGLPDVGPAIRVMRGERDWGAKLRFALKRNQVKTALLKTLGVVPGRRMGSQALALCHLFHVAAAQRGYAQTVHALMREDNTSLRMSGHRGGEPFKRYALYQLGF